MKVSRNEKGCGPFQPGNGYIVEDAPAVRDIQAGGTWVLRTTGSEDTLTFVDTSQKQAMAFPTDEAYNAFKKARSTDIAWDHNANGQAESKRNQDTRTAALAGTRALYGTDPTPTQRAAAMFALARNLDDTYFEAQGWPAMEQPQKTGGVKAAAAAAAAKAAEPKAAKAKTADRGDER
jgi:hypothetical protein